MVYELPKLVMLEMCVGAQNVLVRQEKFNKQRRKTIAGCCPGKYNNNQRRS